MMITHSRFPLGIMVVTVKEYVNYVNMPESGLDCKSRHSKSCVVNDGSLSTEVLTVAIQWVPRCEK